jgi:hypothetical protein
MEEVMCKTQLKTTVLGATGLEIRSGMLTVGTARSTP